MLDLCEVGQDLKADAVGTQQTVSVHESLEEAVCRRTREEAWEQKLLEEAELWIQGG